MPTALAISPHLDDAVFSAGGALARLAHDGWRVVVATVFTASVPDPKGFALACQLDKGIGPDIDYMALRREEDAVACEAIRAEPIWLPFAEAPHRGYVSASDLFEGLHDDDRIIDEIRPILREVITFHSPDMILAPQAVGAHVDHVAVYMALRSARSPIKFWTDFPYSLRPSGRKSPFQDLAALEEERINLTPREFELKIAAIMAYNSQLGFQFGETDIVDSFLQIHGKVECFRRLSEI